MKDFKDLNKNELLAWYIFHKLDLVPEHKETPSEIYKIISQFGKIDINEIIEELTLEYGASLEKME